MFFEISRTNALFSKRFIWAVDGYSPGNYCQQRNENVNDKIEKYPVVRKRTILHIDIKPAINTYTDLKDDHHDHT